MFALERQEITAVPCSQSRSALREEAIEIVSRGEALSRSLEGRLQAAGISATEIATSASRRLKAARA